MKEINKELIEKILKDNKGLILATDEIMVIEGDLPTIMAIFSSIVYSLRKKLPRGFVKHAFELGLTKDPINLEEDEKSDDDKLKKLLKSMLKDLAKEINEAIGDDEDE